MLSRLWAFGETADGLFLRTSSTARSAMEPTRQPSDKTMNLADAIRTLEALKDDHARIGKQTMRKVIYPLDLLALAIIIGRFV